MVGSGSFAKITELSWISNYCISLIELHRVHKQLFMVAQTADTTPSHKLFWPLASRAKNVCRQERVYNLVYGASTISSHGPWSSLVDDTIVQCSYNHSFYLIEFKSWWLHFQWLFVRTRLASRHVHQRAA